MRSVATGLAQSPEASPKLAANAVANAMKKADISSANGVLLFITVELLPCLHQAIRAAAKVAKTTQVFGCSAAGIFTEEDWVLDCPAAAAIVFSGDIHLGLAAQNLNNIPRLTLSTRLDTFESEGINYGAIIGDATGQGLHVTWENAHSKLKQQAQTHLNGVALATATSHGLTIFSPPRVVEASQQFDILQTNDMQAHNDLFDMWHKHADANRTFATSALTLIYADNASALLSGHFSQADVISINGVEGSVTLTKAIPKGTFFCWAIHNNQASNEIAGIIETLSSQLDTHKPSFGLCFSTLNRGPFKDGIDHDLNAIKKSLPATPLIGCYGNGTIDHINDHNQVLTHALVLNLFKIK